jgi:hypothetical protein
MKKYPLFLAFLITTCIIAFSNPSAKGQSSVGQGNALRFTVSDPSYIELTQESITQEFEDAADYMSDDYADDVEYELRRKLSNSGTKCYSLKNDISENIIIELAAAYIDDKMFESLMKNMEEYMHAALDGVEMKIIGSGIDKYKESYKYYYITSFIPSIERYTYAYFFSISGKTYAVIINNKRDNVLIDKMIKVNII